MSCLYCGARVRKFTFDKQVQPVLRRLLEESALSYFEKKEVFNRKNGYCINCGLQQSTNIPNLHLLKILYATFSQADVSEALSGDFPSPLALDNFSKNVFKRRIDLFNQFNLQHQFSPRHVAMMRYQDGSILEYFGEQFNSTLWGWEPVQSLRNHCDHQLAIKQLPIDFHGRFVYTGNASENLPKFDLLICFHSLLHSAIPRDDLLFLKGLCRTGSLIIFMDEIMIKRRNPFHMTHPKEEHFSRFLASNFPRIMRVANAGNPEKHIVDHSFNGDNPDYWCWVE